MDILACAIYYDFDISIIIRYVRGNYTAEYRKPQKIIDLLNKAKCPNKIVSDLEKILTFGCPTKLNAHGSLKNFNTYLKYGNHKSVIKNKEKIYKTMVKEINKSHVLMLPQWTTRLCRNIHITP